jgi:hypothetical protein
MVGIIRLFSALIALLSYMMNLRRTERFRFDTLSLSFPLRFQRENFAFTLRLKIGVRDAMAGTAPTSR